MEKPSFGDLLRELRNERKLSLRAVAELTGLSYSYIAQLEKVRHGSGKPVTPSVDALIKLARVYGMGRGEMVELYWSVADSDLLDEANEHMRALDELIAGISNKTPRKFDIGEYLLNGMERMNRVAESSDVFFYKGIPIRSSKQDFKLVLEKAMDELDDLSKIEKMGEKK